jgi:hypothetical protein
VTFEETVEAVELFKKQIVTIIPNHCFVLESEQRKKENK